MTTTKLFAYTHQLSAMPGETVDVMISAEATRTADISLVRIIHGDQNPNGPGYLDEVIDAGLPKQVDVKRQYHQMGSYAIVDDPTLPFDQVSDFAVSCFVWASLVGGKRQSIIGNFSIADAKGWALGINAEGFLEFWVGDGEDTDAVASEVPVEPGCWYWVGVRYHHKQRMVELSLRSRVTETNSVRGECVPEDLDSVVVGRLRRRMLGSHRPLVISGCWDHNHARGNFLRWMFNGKLEQPAIWNHRSVPDWDGLVDGGPIVDPFAHWDTSRGLAATGVASDLEDVGGRGLHATGVNGPVRAMTGWRWDASAEYFAATPDHYGAAYFADDALLDCGWDATVSFTVPEVRSGYFALRIEADGVIEFAAFFVRPRAPQAKVVFQVPTASYLAYANERLAFDTPVAQSIVGHTPVVSDADIAMYKESNFGLSTYDLHADHLQGCSRSGWRRPILNMRPMHRAATIDCPWQYHRMEVSL